MLIVIVVVERRATTADENPNSRACRQQCIPLTNSENSIGRKERPSTSITVCDEFPLGIDIGTVAHVVVNSMDRTTRALKSKQIRYAYVHCIAFVCSSALLQPSSNKEVHAMAIDRSTAERTNFESKRALYPTCYEIKWIYILIVRSKAMN